MNEFRVYDARRLRAACRAARLLSVEGGHDLRMVPGAHGHRVVAS